jgi:predicted dehydrogenase
MSKPTPTGRASTPYRVVLVGMGKRGMHHAAAFKKNPRFEVVGIAGRDRGRLEKAAAELGLAPSTVSTDPAALARAARPDLFCFCTPPSVRLPLIELGIQAGARLIAYEKPIALSMNEALTIRDLVTRAGVKTVVSHQHRYGQHYRKVRELIESGALGRVHTVYAQGTGWSTHMFTHFVDLMRWYAGNPEAEWVMGQAAGRGKLTDIHPSPDYVAGLINFAGGIRGTIECGAGAPDVPEVDAWWRKNRIGAQGSEGFAEALTGGGWRAVTRSGLASGPGSMNYDLDMPPYVDEMADWLDDDARVHQCNGESAHKGFEILMGTLRSVVERGQIPLPLPPGEPELEALSRVLPDRPVLLSGDFNRKEYLR